MKLELLLCLLFLTTAASQDLLENSDFELPPSNVKTNTSIPFLLLTQNNPIPGWSFNGTVQYVTAGPNVSLPNNGHAIQLGLDGMINQTFKRDEEDMQYLLTFTLAPGGENCSTSSILNVSVPGKLSLFSLEQRYGKEEWESHACFLGRSGSWKDGEHVNLMIQSQPVEADPNFTCGPIVDTLILKRIGLPVGSDDNELVNGDFEVGPAFVTNSAEGVLLDENVYLFESPLQQWSVMGTVKYIDSEHYLVPQGNAATETVSGDLAGIQTKLELKKGSTYNLEFVMGDANNSCTGDFILGVQAGSATQNFTLQSNGTGTTSNFSMKFKADSSITSISFLSFTKSQTRDFVFCGPVIDNVVLRESDGIKLELRRRVFFLALLSLLLL